MLASVSYAGPAWGYPPRPGSGGPPAADSSSGRASEPLRPQSGQTKAKPSQPNELSEEEKRQVDELKRRDAEVRNHENAHLAAAGSLAMGGPNYVYQTGPDGKQYAIGGDVQIDTAPGRTPEETIRKARQIRAAALAPSEPSAQDVKVASAAASMEMEASQKLNEKSRDPSPANGSDPLAPLPEQSDAPITSARQLFPSDGPGPATPAPAWAAKRYATSS